MKEFQEHNIEEKKRQTYARPVLFPLVFVLLIWLVKFIEVYFDISFARFGILPQNLSGLKGIIFSPLIHGDYSHLASNSLPILVLGGMLFYFYKTIAFKVIFLGWFMLGFWLWIIGRESFHIGASGLIYCIAAFLFVSGIIRKHNGLMAVSLVVAFLYGSIIWGVFPLKEQMSWEGHLSGLIAGIVLAYFYKEQGPQRKLYTWELEDDEEELCQEEEYDIQDKNYSSTYT